MSHCNDCKVDTHDIQEYYSVYDAICHEATKDTKIMLCIGCLENRLGRQLNKDDFTDYPINYVFLQSDRLIDRLRST